MIVYTLKLTYNNYRPVANFKKRYWHQPHSMQASDMLVEDFKKECNGRPISIHDDKLSLVWDAIEFDTEEDALMFVLKWS